MILDATAGNRSIWKQKNSENIIYIDIEKELDVKPTLYADNTQTPFGDFTFDTIFYDPPHDYAKVTGQASFPNKNALNEYREAHGWTTRGMMYYGHEKYLTKSALIKHLYKAEKEFSRILKSDGLLWVKWNECRLELGTLLIIFKENWVELLRLYVNSPTQTLGIHQTYWVSFTRKKQSSQQTSLDDPDISVTCCYENAEEVNQHE